MFSSHTESIPTVFSASPFVTDVVTWPQRVYTAEVVYEGVSKSLRTESVTK